MTMETNPNITVATGSTGVEGHAFNQFSDAGNNKKVKNGGNAKKVNKNKNLLSLYFVYVVCGFAAVSLFMAFSADDQRSILGSSRTDDGASSVMNHQHQQLESSKVSLSDLKRKKQQKQTKQTQQQNIPQQQKRDESNQQPIPSKPASSSLKSSLAGLSCGDHHGPYDDSLTDEMVYWQDIPNDNHHVSPFYAPHRYLTFEPDHGGFNNIRMAMETVVALAYAMGRTLVLPPAQHMYLLGGKELTFADFFDMPAIHAEHNGLDIISTEEFLKRQQQDKNSSNPLKNLIPADGRTNWDGSERSWFQHLRTHAKNLIWDPNKCFAYFPSSPKQLQNPQDDEKLQERYKELIRDLEKHAVERKFNPHETWNLFIGKPTPLNATEDYRLQEFHAGRSSLCLYDNQLQNEPLLHFPAVFKVGQTHRNIENKTSEQENIEKAKNGWDPRLLVHFYAFLFFSDIHQDLWMKRFVRDHFRYTDEIQCAAARVVAEMRRQVRTVHGRSDGQFHTMHVRRGDFQYTITRVSAEELLKQTQTQFKDGDVVYIATDHRDKTFFQPLEQHYHIYFLDDFMQNTDDHNSPSKKNVSAVLGPEVVSSFYGMVDQLVASRGKLFFGCWFSTFTGYINRLRGYHSQKNKEPGYEEGKIMTSFYYAPPDRYKHMWTYYPVKQSFYAREFPTSWRLLNRDVAQ